MNSFDYPPNKGVFMLDQVNCVGNETDLTQCEHDPWKHHNCRSYEIAGVECQMNKGNFHVGVL